MWPDGLPEPEGLGLFDLLVCQIARSKPGEWERVARTWERSGRGPSPAEEAGVAGGKGP